MLVSGGVARLLALELNDETLESESEAKPRNTHWNITELGFQKVQFAKGFLEFDQTRVFIADISENFLKLLPDKIREICCDARHL